MRTDDEVRRVLARALWDGILDTALARIITWWRRGEPHPHPLLIAHDPFHLHMGWNTIRAVEAGLTDAQQDSYREQLWLRLNEPRIENATEEEWERMLRHPPEIAAVARALATVLTADDSSYDD